jgi:hypothetical protein
MVYWFFCSGHFRDVILTAADASENQNKNARAVPAWLSALLDHITPGIFGMTDMG